MKQENKTLGMGPPILTVAVVVGSRSSNRSDERGTSDKTAARPVVEGGWRVESLEEVAKSITISDIDEVFSAD